MKIAVLLSGSGRTLQNFIDSGIKPVVVISSKAGVYGLERAKKHNIPNHTIPRADYKTDAEFSKAITETLKQYKPDLIAMAGFLNRYEIPPQYTGKVMNIHPALLPAFGGKNYYGDRVHKAVIESGVKFSGCTVHFADNEYDRGPIIVQRVVPVADNDTPTTLADRVFREECIAYLEAIRLFEAGKLKVVGRRVIKI
ncbi:MAG: phosphoribosylglycinamide formyltransferase [Planctomycetes bacterium]|nr:phosphoribosylglycinamide formyltransferase [Planctomycetota bacterium]